MMVYLVESSKDKKMKIKRYLIVKAGEVLLVIATLLLCLSFKVHSQNQTPSTSKIIMSQSKDEAVRGKTEAIALNNTVLNFDEAETFSTFEEN